MSADSVLATARKPAGRSAEVPGRFRGLAAPCRALDRARGVLVLR